MGGSRRANRLIKSGRNKGIVIEIGSYISFDKQKTNYIYVKPPNKKLVKAVSYGSDVYISDNICIGDKVELVAMKLPYGYAWIKENEACDYIKNEGINRDYEPYDVIDSETDIEESEYGYTHSVFISK